MEKDIKTKKLLKTILILCVICFCIFYLRLKVTYTAYESLTSGDVNAKIADWNITVNNENITQTISKTVNLGDITWENANANPDKVAPSSKGVLNVVIDPTTTSVAIKYCIKITDKTLDDTKLLTVTSVSDLDNDIVRTAADTYTGIISLADIKNKSLKTITINLEWVNDDTVNDLENTNTEYVDLDFTAYQYKGEAITAYNG